MAEWSLHAEQFAALWLSAAYDRMPFPFRFVSTLATLDEYERHHSRFRTSIESTEYDTLRGAFAVLANPAVRIEVFGFAAGQEVRHIGCADADSGVVAAQNPVTDAVELTTLSPRVLGTAMAVRIPVERAGSVAAQQFHAAELDKPDGHTFAPDAVTPRRRYARLQATSNAGTIHITDGPRHGDAPTRRIRWYDVPGDGCYLETRNGTTVSITPGAHDEIRTRLDKELSRR